MYCYTCGAYWGLYEVFEDPYTPLCSSCKEEKRMYDWTKNGPVLRKEAAS